jgi:hypothetical protein
LQKDYQESLLKHFKIKELFARIFGVANSFFLNHVLNVRSIKKNFLRLESTYN